ncbi:MAG: ABC transporter ATP-binding protein [Pseudomonadota bacterium]|jgi:putative ABC transport system ATP-binding protein
METNESNSKIEIKGVGIRKTYRMGEVDVPVLKGIDLEIFKGELTVILGSSGSGKSTLMNIIGGIDRPTSGEVWCGDRNIAQLTDRQLTEYRRQNVGFVFQFYNLVPTLTSLENVEVCTQIADNPMPPEKALELVDLADHMGHFPAQMSGGQQQRVAIARALAKNPRLMLCDEPTGALDSKTGQLVLSLLTKLNNEIGATIVIITHAAPIAELAHRVLRLTSEGITSHKNDDRAKVEEISW